MRALIRKRAVRIVDAQTTLALGNHVLLERQGGKFVIVKDPDRITAFLNKETKDDGGVYLIATDRPDNSAIKDILDREFGKPKETTEHKFPDPVRVVHTFRGAGA